MGRTATRTRLSSHEKLSRDGSACGITHGAIRCSRGFTGGIEGSGEDKSWGDVGVDW